MNKKFSTLVASLLLATTVGTGYAQVQKGTISERPDMAYINAIEEGKFYQLTNGTKVLIMEQASNGTYVLKYVDFNKAELAKSLWSIKAEKKGASGLVFQFVNLASGLPISFDSDEIKGNGVTPISEGTNQWVWARGVAGNAANQFYAMEAFFGAENDSVMTLTSGRDGVVSAFRYATKDFSQQIADRRLKFVAKEAREVYLNAYDLNTMLQTMPEDKLQLTFNAEPKKAQLDNEFTIRQYKAEDAVAENSWSKGSVEDLKDKMEAADAAMEKANLAYYAKVKEGSEADAALRELLAGWDKVGQRVDQLEEATKNAEIVQKKAYETYEEYANDVAALQAQIAESESSEELLEKLTEAQEALEDANEKLSAAENKQIELKNIAKEKEDAYNDAKWGDKVKLYMEWQKALLGLKEHEKTLPSLRAAVDLAEANVDSAADNLAAGSELASELSAAINKRDNAKGEYDKKLSAYEDLDAQLTEAKLEEAGLYAKVDASTEDVNGIIAEVSRLLRIKKAATRWYFVAVDNYASAQSMGENWLSLWTGTKDAKGRKQYLMVDTAYMEDASVLGDKHQKFAITHYDDFSNYCSHVANYRDINGRFNFRFKYYPSADSLVITADGGYDKPETVKYWADRVYAGPVAGRNFVKLANLGDRQEVSLGAPDAVKGTRGYTLNTRIGLGLQVANKDAVPAGVYFIDVVNSDDKQRNGARLMLDLDGQTLTKVAPAEWDVMNFAHMPAVKWVVSESTIYNNTPVIRNQESAERLNDWGTYRIVSVKDGVITLEVKYFNYQDKRFTETVKLTPVTDVNENGYYHASFTANTDTLVTFTYLNIAGNLSVQIGNKAVGEDTILRVAEGEGTKFVFEMAKPAVEKYGVDKAFEKGQYYIRVNDADKLTNNFKYVQISEVDGTEMLVVAGKETATPFYLKEVNCDENGVHYYALLAESKKAGVIDASGLIKAENLMIETRTSAFAVNELKTRFYREFTEEELSNNNMLKFYRTASTEKEYLYAAAPENDMTFLAVEGKGDNAAAAAEMTVIPTTEAGVLMPQYFIARNVVEQAGAIDFCGEEHKALEDSLACPHTKFVPDTVFGDFLVNLKIDTKKYGKYNWEGQYTRLAFLKGYAVKEKGVLPGEGEYTKLYIDGKEVSADNAHSATKFEFRLVNDNEEQDFLIESESHNKTYFDGGVRPKDGGWVKIQNGVPVIVAASYENAIQGDVFNADVAEGGATANDEITTSEITVIAGEGNVTIANAAGKKVVVSNILGQIVATQVLTSDNAVIAAPQGVVVVAVEGEEAVKAIVK
ncbi:DUF6383 domain-containing protein [Parabacteroides johnsonii]|uniref:DUF6383 domain-containing protein n=1 Tax=Parabacteroides johnsonii TaxID=387661 RepID=UPI00242C536C|nr:DUF6383 domain-containing protein [Parabacteroides johnsonii]MBS6225141.1 hypothetical protein [Parabacteroides johnsonii]